MKRKIFSVLFALVLLCSFSLVTAVPAAGATTADQEAAITAAADRLLPVQNLDGGFPWKAPPDGPSTTNCQGVTAMAIMEAWKIEVKPTYATALALAYKFVVDKEPAFTWSEVDSRYNETTKGVDSFPDITFLIELANAADSDAGLLAAIALAVPDTVPGDISALASSRWDGRINHLGAAIENDPHPTATRMAEYIRDVVRHPDYDAILPWDLAQAIEAALALDSVYPGEGYGQQALDIAGVVHASVDDLADTYFSSTDDTQNDYILGLAGAILAYERLGLYPTEVADYLALLLGKQQPGGYWNYYSANPAVEKGVQSTAYAAWALFREGSDNARTAANEAADWLISTQQLGGWFTNVAPETNDPTECYEVNGEAAWALAVIGTVSVELNEDWYRTLDTVDVTVDDAVANDPLREDEVEVTAKSDTDAFGITLTLTETDFDTGVFTGSFGLVEEPVPPPPATIMVADGDLITVTYLNVTDTATVDDTPPVISNVSPVDEAIVPDATPLISATLADDASGIDTTVGEMTIDGGTVAAVVTESTISYTPGEALADGEHTITVGVFDVAGNAATPVSWSFTVDTEKPMVTVALAPDLPAYTIEGTITFTLTFNEPMDTSVSPVASFGQFDPYGDHGVVELGWTERSQTEWVGTFVIDGTWTILDDGLQTLSISGAQDLAGNVMLEDLSTSFVIDLNPPLAPVDVFVEENPPDTPDAVYGRDGAVEDNALVEVWDNEVERDPDINLINSINATANGDFGPIDIGNNLYDTVWVTAADAYGHRSGATELWNDIDVRIWSSDWSVLGEKPLWLLMDDVIDFIIEGESDCTATVDIGEAVTGIVLDEDTTGTYTVSYTVLAGDDVADAVVTYRLVDAAGNSGTDTDSVPISIDTEAPIIGPLTPADGSFVNTAMPEISAVLDDNLSGIGSIVMTLDDGSVPPLSEGEHKVTLDVSDVAGNAAVQKIWYFTVDTVGPVITIHPVTTPTDVDTQFITGNWAEENLDTITVTVNGAPVVIGTRTDIWATEPDEAALDEGDNSVVATITDKAGNSASARTTINLDTEDPVVTVISPNGGESWLSGNMYNITWTAFDPNLASSPIAIEYSIDGGSSWNDVAMAELNDGGCLWAVPKLDSSDCLVRVTGTDLLGHSGSDVSDTAFTITTTEVPIDTIAPAVTVNSPNGGEVWQPGETQTITWTATDDKTPGGDLLVDLYYSSNGGTVWESIASDVANNGAYSWPVPEINSDQCLVKVEARDTSGNADFDISNTVFAIATPEAPVVITDITLEAGWNLVSLMLIPTSANITDVLDGIDVVSVWAYDASTENLTERWSSYVPREVPGDLETMVDGKGYWIEMSSPAVLTIVGEELPDPPAAMPAYSVVEGWNLIGFKSTTPKTADSYLLAIEGKYTIVRGYVPTSPSYFDVGAEEDLDPGSGYWISIIESGTIYP